MLRSSLVALSLAFLTLLAPVDAAESHPAFPIDMDIEYCWDDLGCYDMIVSVDDDGTFVDSDGDYGVWFYRADDRAMLLRYEDRAEGVEFYGIRTGECFAGRTFLDGEEDAVWVGCRR